MPPAPQRRRRWAELPSELLAVVSARLHDPTDFVRFHAVCCSWRDSLPPPQTSALRPVLFPWLVAPPSRSGRRFSVIRPRCVFSKTSYHKEVCSSFHKLGCVARADGMAYCFFSARDGPKLVDPLTTRDTTPLPPFPYGDKRKMRDKSRGVVYGDGTIFLYHFSKSDNNHEQGTTTSTNLRAAIFSPGDTEWTVIERTFRMRRKNIAFENNRCFAAYHDGKILVCVDGDHCNDIWHLMAPSASAGGVHTSVVVESSKDMWGLNSSHVLESHGELLRVSILVMYLKTGSSMKRVVTVLVHALEEETGTDGRQMVRWARRDGLSFADRVMFLGFPSSFAVDAARFHGVDYDVIGGVFTS
ncbi:hypothetical protein ZWY2020_023731 [Hordeum vulgare]|nr:hypothetical protein ZWY2020_023731 [Hordeum vulgare]